MLPRVCSVTRNLTCVQQMLTGQLPHPSNAAGCGCNALECRAGGGCHPNPHPCRQAKRECELRHFDLSLGTWAVPGGMGALKPSRMPLHSTLTGSARLELVWARLTLSRPRRPQVVVYVQNAYTSAAGRESEASDGTYVGAQARAVQWA